MHIKLFRETTHRDGAVCVRGEGVTFSRSTKSSALGAYTEKKSFFKKLYKNKKGHISLYNLKKV